MYLSEYRTYFGKMGNNAAMVCETAVGYVWRTPNGQARWFTLAVTAGPELGCKLADMLATEDVQTIYVYDGWARSVVYFARPRES